MNLLGKVEKDRYILKIATLFAKDVVSKVQADIASDPNGFFVYKYPKPKEIPYDLYADSESDTVTTSSSEKEPVFIKAIDWCTIGNFMPSSVYGQIVDFVLTWNLSPSTKFVLMPKLDPEEIEAKGVRHFVDVVFSKPTQRCPNPLAVAEVHFEIHVSNLLPKYYPIMVTYKFETFNTQFFALGEKSLDSVDFQRFYIDTLLNRKLAFYALMFECRHPETKTPKPNTVVDVASLQAFGTNINKSRVSFDKKEPESETQPEPDTDSVEIKSKSSVL